MKKKIFTVMLCCGVLSSFSQHIQKDISGLTYLDKGQKLTVVSNNLRGDKPTPEELLACPKNSVKSGEFVNEGFVGYQSSDQGRPGFHSKFFQSFTDNYFTVNAVRSYALFNTFDKEEIKWSECDDRGKINDKFQMTEPIRLEVGFYKRDAETGLPGEVIYKEEVDVLGKFSGVELGMDGKIYIFDIPLKEEVKAESGYLSVSAVDMKDNPTCWYSVLTCESVPGNSAISIDGNLMFAGNHMTYCMMGTGAYSAKKALKISSISMPEAYSNSKFQKVKVTVKNVGSESLDDVALELLLDGKTIAVEKITQPINSLESFSYIFHHRIDCSDSGDHIIEIRNQTPSDERLCDSTLSKSLYSLKKGEYCTSKSMMTDYGHIKKVTIGNIDNESEASNYSDFSDMKTPIKKGDKLNLHVEYKPGPKYLSVWVDWNNNGTFDDEGEHIGFITENDLELSIPEGVELTPGDKRLRIVFSDDLVGACSSYAVGETEDYTLTVVAPEESSVISTIDEIVATHPKEGNTHTEELMIANKGNEDLKGDIKVKYYLTNAPFEIGTRSNLKHPTLSFVTRPQTGLRAETQSSDPVLDDNTDYVLKYDKGVFSSITPSGVEEAIIGHRYGQEMISDLRGMKINSLDIFIGDAPGYAEAQVYGGESQNEPKDLLVSKEFKPTPNSWNRIVFDKPIVIENQDIWIAVKMKGFKEGQFCMGVDRGPAIVGGSDFVNVGNGVWWKMGNYGLDYNFCLRANLQGENQPAINWLKLSDYSFDVKPGAESKISLNFNNENLEKHFYEAELIINSNDKIGNLKKIKVFYINTAIVTGIDQINTDKAHVRYLADQSKLQIDSDRDIKLIAIYDITGSLLDTKNNPGSSVQFSLDKMTSEVVLIIQYEDGGREAIKVML